MLSCLSCILRHPVYICRPPLLNRFNGCRHQDLYNIKLRGSSPSNKIQGYNICNKQGYNNYNKQGCNIYIKQGNNNYNKQGYNNYNKQGSNNYNKQGNYNTTINREIITTTNSLGSIYTVYCILHVFCDT